MQDLRIVFIGTTDFSAASLKILVENKVNIVGVVTAPDRPAGRGQKIKQPPVKQYAESVGLKVMQPTNLKDTDFLAELKALNANLQIVVAFRMLPEAVWDMPELGTFNLHASLLPQYRGAAPINWAIMNGEAMTGVTTFFLKHKIDTGDIIFKEKVRIQKDDTFGDLYFKLMDVGAELVLKTVWAIQSGDYETTPQNPKDYDYILEAPKLFKSDCEIDWDTVAEYVYNHVRGLNPHPAAWTVFEIGGKDIRFKVFEVDIEIAEHNIENGQLIVDHKNEMRVSVPNGFVILKTIQPEGKKPMSSKDFVNGMK